MGQRVLLPERHKVWKAGQTYDKETSEMVVRIGLLIHIKGTGNMVLPPRVLMWQREKAECACVFVSVC